MRSQFSPGQEFYGAITESKSRAGTARVRSDHFCLVSPGILKCQSQKEKETARREIGRALARSGKYPRPRSLLRTGFAAIAAGAAISLCERSERGRHAQVRR